MSRAKVFTSILTVLIFIVLSGASVWAAPGWQEDPTATPTETLTPEPTATPEPPIIHPVATALAEFFAEALGLDYDTIMGYHEDGMGFGVIAQACWMSFALEGDAALVGDILAAKKNGDFSITLPDETTITAKNWGQFKKAVLGDEKTHKNLGAIMSGRAKGEQEQDQEQNQDRDRNRDQDQEQNQDRDRNRDQEQNQDRDRNRDQDQVKDKTGKSSDEGDSGPPVEPPGKSKNKGGEGGGPPAEPPGQDKGGGKGKDK